MSVSQERRAVIAGCLALPVPYLVALLFAQLPLPVRLGFDMGWIFVLSFVPTAIAAAWLARLPFRRAGVPTVYLTELTLFAILGEFVGILLLAVLVLFALLTWFIPMSATL